MAAHSPLQVIQITDTHLKAQPGSRLWGVDVDSSLTAVLARMQQRHWPADLILATGDLVQDEGLAGYRRVREFLEPLGVPIYCLAGNHDKASLLAQTLNQGLVSAPRHVLAGSWQFLLLDSSVPGQTGGRLGEETLDFLDLTLTAHPEHWAMVCLHHQPLNIQSDWLDTMTVDNGDRLFQVLDRHPQVRAVIWGHIHQAFAARRNGVELLGAPSTCVQFKPGLPGPAADDLPPGYRWFRLFADGVLETGVERTDPLPPGN